MLDKMDREVSEGGQIQAVQPDHWAAAILAMIMVVPSRRQDYIPLLHADASAMHRRKAPVALDDIAHRKCGVPVRWGGLIRHDKLQAGVECIGGVRGIYSIGWGVSLAGLERTTSLTNCKGDIPRAGFTSIRTLRSACFSVTR